MLGGVATLQSFFSNFNNSNGLRERHYLTTIIVVITLCCS